MARVKSKKVNDMIHRLTYMAFVWLLMLSTACGRKSADSAGANTVQTDSLSEVRAKYAKGFSVRYTPDGVALLEIKDPVGKKNETYRFALVKKAERGAVPEGYTEVNVPVENVVCMSSLQVSNFTCLGLAGLVRGVGSTMHMDHPDMQKQLKSGHTIKVGAENGVNNEAIIAIDPDVIFTSPHKSASGLNLPGVENTQVPHLGYQELTPLGQAEWMKVAGLFTGHEREANARFAEIEKSYNTLKAKAAAVKHRPIVFTGNMTGGSWYTMGGRSFMANLFRDAGAEYVLADNPETGSLHLDFEAIYAKAANADYWRTISSFDGDFTYADLLAQDARYADFRAFKNKGVIFCNLKNTPMYDRLPVEPHELLADFIQVFHPELVPASRKPRFFHLLKK